MSATDTSSPTSGEPLYSEFADDPEMLEILEPFFESLTERKLSLNQAYQANSWDVLSDVAHQLKGAGGGYGFPEITDVAAEVELLGKRMIADESARTELDQQLSELLLLCDRAIAGAEGRQV